MPRHSANGDRATVAGFLRESLGEVAGARVVAVVNLPAPAAPLLTFLETVPRNVSFLWHNAPSGIDCAGGGVTQRIDVSGDTRMIQLQEQAESLWARIQVFSHPDAPPYTPRLVGGLAFAPSNSRRWPWSAFGDGTFSLARWTYGRVHGRPFLSLAVHCDQRSGTWCEDVLQEYEAIVGALVGPDGTSFSLGKHSSGPPLGIRQLPVGEWEAHIGQIHEAIASGRFLKIVAARRCDVTLKDAPSDIEVINRLSTESKCTHFAFRRAESTFVGASPELLFLKSGLDLRTQALAGTARSSSPGLHAGQTKQLLGSTKDRHEHDFVVSSIRDALMPLCTDVCVAKSPEVLALRNIIHINTPFEARVRPETHVAELLEALHPTPAVGGVPGHAAREWIIAHERDERGWYTGPVGWFDSRGDAEFAVAIRCGVLAGAQAHLYTGAGVVLASNYIDEYAETALKQLPMLRALGVEVEPADAITRPHPSATRSGRHDGVPAEPGSPEH